jgi:uncharacterized protein
MKEANKLLSEAEEAELDLLDEYLRSERAPANGMVLSELDGFLSALVAGPEPIASKEWMPLVWGGAEPEFEDAAESERIPKAIFNRYKWIDEALRDEDGLYAPLLWQTPEGKTIADDWAQGFMTAVGLRLDLWDELIRHKRDGFLMMPIMALYRGPNGESVLSLDELDEELSEEDLPDLIPLSVEGIFDFWQLRAAGYGAASVKNPPKIGRNDACPCGSGKKYKKCCG